MPINLQNGLVGWWPSDNALDKSINNFDGVVSGAVLTQMIWQSKLCI